jgi:hypothetical protein
MGENGANIFPLPRRQFESISKSAVELGEFER